MVVFLIILAVIVLITSVILSISATFTITYNSSWKTTVKLLWIDKEIELSEVLSFVLFPEKKAAEKRSDLKKNSSSKDKSDKKEMSDDISEAENEQSEDKNSKAKVNKPKKENYIKEIWNKDGIVGIMNFASNLFETASDAILTLFRGFHIRSLYVKILVGGQDAADTAQAYGRICRYYYPLKGMILNGMKVDNYDDWIAPDFIALRNEYGLQFIGSISVLTVLKVLFSAGKTYLFNMIKK